MGDVVLSKYDTALGPSSPSYLHSLLPTSLLLLYSAESLGELRAQPPPRKRAEFCCETVARVTDEPTKPAASSRTRHHGSVDGPGAAPSAAAPRGYSVAQEILNALACLGALLISSSLTGAARQHGRAA